MIGQSAARSARRRWWRTPEWLFFLFASLGGSILLVMIPPLAGGNEQLNFQRVAGIVSGEIMVGPVAMPGGVADLLDITDKRFPEGAKAPYHYARADFDRLASLDLRADRPKVVQPSPIAVLNPVSYLPQILVVRIGEDLGLKPIGLFFAGRLAGLLTAILLTLAAIRVMPAHKYGLVAIALLPPILFSRSTLDADQLTNALAFLTLALLYREIAAAGPIKNGRVALLASTAFILAQAKSAYFLLAFLTLAIPRERYTSQRHRWSAAALICLPGMVASAAWMVSIKANYFDSARYRTWSGIVDPHAQFALVISQPLSFAATLLRTIFATPLVPRSLMEFLGVFGPPVALPLPFYPMLAILLGGVLLAGGTTTPDTLQNRRTRATALVIAMLTILIVLSLLYLQWTAYGRNVVDGFRGSYLYPLAPLLLLAVPRGGSPVFGFSAPKWTAALGAVSFAGTVWLTWWAYLS